MAPFSNSDLNDFDYRLLLDGPVVLFWGEAVLDECVNELKLRKYSVRIMEAQGLSIAALMDEFARLLDFPDYFGKNLDALNDCLYGVAHGAYGWDAGCDTGLVLVLRHYDSFTAANPKEAQIIADIFATNSREALLLGNRLIALLQVDDADFALAPAGATVVHWNDNEWFDLSRKSVPKQG